MEIKLENRSLVWLLVGLAILALAALTPDIPGLAFQGKMALAILLVSIIFWASNCMPVPITAMGMMATIPLFGIMTFNETWTASMNSLILFLVGAFAFTVFLKHSTVADRLVAGVLKWSGTNPKKILLGFILLSAVLSTVVSSNIALCTLMMALAQSLLEAGRCKEGESKLGKSLAIAIPWSVVVGSMLTPWGNPINLMVIGIVQTTFQIVIPFTTWIAVGFIPVVVILASIWIACVRVYKPEPLSSEAVEFGIKRAAELPKMELREKLNVVVILATIALWIAGGWFPILNTTMVALIALAVLFMPKIRVITYGDYVKESPWGLLLMLMAVNAMVAALTVSGAVNWLIEGVFSGVGAFPPLAILLICSIVAMALHNVVPGGPAVAGLLTVPFIGFMLAAGEGVTAMAMMVAWWAGIAYLLPLDAVNLVTYQGYKYYGFGDMAKAGWVPTLVQIVCTVTLLPFIAGLLGAP